MRDYGGSQMKISVVGYGTVGQAVHNSLVGHDVFIFDPYKGYNDPESVLNTEAMFICVPTQTFESGQDVGLIRETLNRFDSYEGLIVIKSTITPNNLRGLLKSPLSIMHAPEFLNQYEPYFEHTKHLIGVQNIYQANKYREIFGLEGYGHKDVRTTDPITAAMVKYLHNLNGVFQVTFFHIMNDICEKENINYRECLGAALSMTPHINPTYTKIAADGEKGFGGKCFGDNITAFASEYNNHMFDAVVKTNTEYRPVYMAGFRRPNGL